MADLRRFRFVLLVVVLAALIAAPGFAQMHEKSTLVSINPVGPLLGVYSASFEQALDVELSISVGATYFNAKAGLLGAGINLAGVEDYEFWSFSGSVGVNYYVSGTAPAGGFVGAAVEPGYLKVTLEQVPVESVLLGAAAYAGYRAFFFDSIAIAPYVGIGYAYAFADFSEIDNDNLRAATGGIAFPFGINVSIAF